MSHAERSTTLLPDRVRLPPGSAWARVPAIALGVGVLGILASIVLGRSQPEQFFFSWLVAYMYFLSIALGGLFFVLAHYVTWASWSVVLRRLAEHIMGTLPLFAALFLPVYFGMRTLFHWSDPEAATHDALLAAKSGYLDENFFLLRAGFYFLCWTVLALWFLRGSLRQDRTGDVALTRTMIRASAPALIVFALTLTFAAIDWMMTLDPHWYSTMFGVYYFAGSLVGNFALMILLAVALVGMGPLREAVTSEHFHDLGKLLYAFSVFWAYIAFSQFFLIWYANMPEETHWYLDRGKGTWGAVAVLLAVGHFAVPFFFLMPRRVKRSPGTLVVAAVWMLFIHLVDLHWLIMPVLHREGIRPSLLDLTTLIGVGGLFLAAVTAQMRRQPLVPIGDPRLAESLSFENV